MVSEASPTSPELIVLQTDACIGLLRTSKITADTITAVSNVVAKDLRFQHTRITDVSDAASDWIEMAEELKATLEGWDSSYRTSSSHVSVAMTIAVSSLH